MRCQEVRELLSEYIDEQLDITRQQEISSHLDECEECRIELEELQNSIDFMHKSPAVMPPPDFRVRLKEQLDFEGNSTYENSSLLYKLSKKHWALATAAALLILAIGFSLMWQQFPGESPRADIAQEEGAGKGESQKSSPGINGSSENAEQESDSAIDEEGINSLERSEDGTQGQNAPSGDDFSMMSEPSDNQEDVSTGNNVVILKLAVEENSLEEVKRNIMSEVSQYESKIENINKTEVEITFSEENYEEILEHISDSGDVLFMEESKTGEELNDNYISVNLQLVPQEEK